MGKVNSQRCPKFKNSKKITTYKLEKLDFEININEKKHFYWMSSSAFRYTFDKYPELKEKYHYCGPGNTYNEIQSILGNDKNLFVELSYDSWKKKLTNK